MPTPIVQPESRRVSGDSRLGSTSQTAQRYAPPGSRVDLPPSPQLTPLDPSNTATVARPAQAAQTPPESRHGLALMRQNSTNTFGLSQESLHGLRALWKDLCTATNILAIAGLVIGFTFGVAATKQTNVQNTQSGKSYELDLWNTCADHESIQNTTTCQQVLSQSFDRFQKRGLSGLDPDIASRIQEVIIKRNTSDEAPMDGGHDTPIERWLAKFAVSDTERQLIFGYHDDRTLQLPEVRALMFPLAEMLYMPIKWILSLIEALLLSVIYSIRTVFRWMGVIFWFCFQAMLYSIAENIVAGVFSVLDTVILDVLPRWIPPVIVSGMGTAVGVSALKSYWYNMSFLWCMTWVLGVRVGLYVVGSTIMFCFRLYGEWRDRSKRQH